MGFERQQFTFYRSFLRAAEQLPPKQRAEFLSALVYYALDEIEPERLSSAARAAFEVVRPVLDKARRKALSGKAGGEASREMRSKTEAESKQTGSKTKQTGSTGISPVYTGAVTEIETDTVTGAYIMASPEGESKETFSEVFDALRRNGVFMADKDNMDCEALCEEYGSRAVVQAIDRARDQNAPRWSYIRAIVTSGGVGGRVAKTRSGYIRHGDPPSPVMMDAIRRTMEEEEFADSSTAALPPLRMTEGGQGNG